MKASDQTILALASKVVTHNARVSVSHDTQRTWQLHIRQVRVTDGGCYVCQINTAPMKEKTGCVDVHGKQSLWGNSPEKLVGQFAAQIVFYFKKNQVGIKIKIFFFLNEITVLAINVLQNPDLDV
ncbi:hypothetical protein ONE63_000227 [Megalurothrips usitatus]|uniref:Immunoglobulin-like beta-sandwich domain-containing protein n=1 Tax=Megalurothrips usitatus TaxID=439358 RepID=A0AAV7XXT1_9NEOP|nr:hypothetical protein ONE63_000227 [Megalurothrips usitatus]